MRKYEEQFWKRRSKHGRDVLFASPEKLWEAATEYFESEDENPWKQEEYKVVDKSLERIEVNRKVPYTWDGLCLYLGVGREYFRNFRQRIASNEIASLTKEQQDNFSGVIELIDITIRTQKFNGAAAGFFNANIIARDLHLAEQVEAKNVNFNSVPLSSEDIKRISDELDNIV